MYMDLGVTTPNLLSWLNPGWHEKRELHCSSNNLKTWGCARLDSIQVNNNLREPQMGEKNF